MCASQSVEGDAADVAGADRFGEFDGSLAPRQREFAFAAVERSHPCKGIGQDATGQVAFLRQGDALLAMGERFGAPARHAGQH